MQTITSTPKVSLTGTSLVQITDGSGNLTLVSTDSVNTNIQRIAGAALAATNALPSRLTDGTSYYDARQIRALTASDVVSAAQSGTWNITNVSGTVSLPTGASTSALQTTGNASLASIDAGIPAALGQTTMAASMPVVIASNQTYIPAGIVIGTLYDPTGTALTIKSAAATYNPPTAGNQATPLVAAVVGKKISVLAYNVQLGVSSANTYLRDGTAGAQLSVLFLRATGGSVPTSYIQSASTGSFLFQTTAGNALITNCATNTGTVSIQVTYVEL